MKRGFYAKPYKVADAKQTSNIALRHKFTVITLVRAFLTNHMMLTHGDSDRGSHFVAGIVRDVCKALHIVQSTTVPYNPSNNRVERHHRTLGKMLQTLTEGRQHLWEQFLPQALFSHRTHVSATTGFAPYTLMFHHNPRTSLDLIFQKPTDETHYRTYEDYAEALRARMLRAEAWARENISEAVHRQRRAYCQARKTYEPGQRVWLFSPKRNPGQSSKWRLRWTGPWTVQAVINDLTYELAPHPSWARQRHETVGIDRIQEYCVAEGDEDDGGTPPGIQESLEMPGDEFAEDLPATAAPDDDDDDDGDGGNIFPGFDQDPVPPAIQLPPPASPPGTPPAALEQGEGAGMHTPPHAVHTPPDDFYTPPQEAAPDVLGGARRRDPKQGRGQKVREQEYREEKRKLEQERQQARESRDAERAARARRREEKY